MVLFWLINKKEIEIKDFIKAVSFPKAERSKCFTSGVSLWLIQSGWIFWVGASQIKFAGAEFE